MSTRADRGIVLTCLAFLLAGALVVVATQGLVYAAVAVVAALYLVVVLTIGAKATGVACMMAAFASAPMYRGIDAITGGVPPTDVFIIAGTIHLFPTMLAHRIRIPTSYVVGLFLMTLSCLVSVIVTGNFATNAFYAVQWIFFVGALPVLVALWRPSLKTVDRLLWAYLGGHLISTAKALAEGAVFANRYDGLTHHPNAFGLAGVISIGMVLYLFHRHRTAGVWLLVVLAGFVGIGVLSITLSGSRAAIVVLVALILLIPVVERSALLGIGLSVLGALGVLSIPLIVQFSGEESAIGRLAGGGTAGGSDRIRENALSDGLDRFWTSPILGTGFDDVELIHNVYVEAAVAIGIIGLLGYVIVMVSLARPLLSRHPLRRLTYTVWIFLGVAPTFPGLWDRTAWVPASLAALAMIAPDGDDAPRVPEAEPAGAEL